MIAYLAVAVALAADPIEVTPLEAVLDTAPPAIALSASEREALDRGDTVYRYERWNGIDGGVAARLVRAPVDVVWKHVLDYDRYVDFMPYVTGSSADRRYRDGDHVDYECSMELTTKGIVTRYTVRNHFHGDDGWMTFRMLPAGGNPLSEATGYWRVEPWDADPTRTLVAYRIDIDTAWYVPGFLKRKAADRGLPTVARLIAKRAEQEMGTYVAPPAP